MEPFIESFDPNQYLNALLCFMFGLMASILIESLTQKDNDNEQH